MCYYGVCKFTNKEAVLAFNSSVTERALTRAGYRCEACGGYWHDLKRSEKDTPLYAHSAISFHIVKNKKTGLYRATSTPTGHERMQGRIIRPNAFLVQRLNRDDDAYCLCYDCHPMVHRIASEITNNKFRTGNGKNAIPHVLENVTICFVLNKGNWTF